MTSKAGGRTILIVDDHADIRELIRLQLQLKGCQVIEATNGREAVELAPRIQPDLIFMDLSMPVLDGYEATRQIHDQPLLKGVPVVAVSAFCDPHNRQKAYDAGCIECVCKPVDFGILDGLLKKHLQVY